SYGWGRVDAYRAVLAALNGPVAVSITAPHERSDVSTSLEVTGWAAWLLPAGSADVAVEAYLESEDGAPIDLGPAETGLPTPEIAQLTGNGRLAASGYRLGVNAAGLPKGHYRLVVVATAPTGEAARYEVDVDLNPT